MKQKICLINHGLSTGGTDAFIMNVIRGLDKEKCDVSLVMALDEQNTCQFHEAEALAEGVHIFRTCDLNGIKKKALHCIKLYGLFKKNGPYNVVHSNMDLFNGLNMLLARLAGVKKRVSHAHTTRSQYETNTKKRKTVYLYRRLMQTLIRKNSTHLLGCGSDAMEYLYGEKWRNDSRSIIIYNGINLQEYIASSSERRLFASKFGIDLSKKNFVTVGHMTEVKNPLFIVDIIAELIKIDHTIHFFWIGTGELLPKIMKHIDDLVATDVFTLLGVRNDVPDLLKCCDYFLLPSLFEGLSISLIEAQAADLDCFVSDSVTQEADCGKCHYISLQKSARQWAEIIYDHLCSEETNEIDKKLLNRFDLDYMLFQLDRLYSAKKTAELMLYK